MKLIILNGPCGVGKSTIAEMLRDALPMSFLIDVDAQRRFIGKYREKEYRESSRYLSFFVALGIVQTCLADGRDVIVDKFIMKDPNIIDKFIGLGRKNNAEVFEIILWAEKDIVLKRAENRGYKVGGSLTPQKCEEFWYQMKDLKEQRPNAVVIPTDDLSVEETFEKVKKVIFG
jgi:broad-specificity NMP kinase